MRRVTNETVTSLLKQAAEAGQLARWVSGAVSACKIDTITDPFTVARNLIVHSRDLAEAANKMMLTCDLQRMQEEAKARQSELEQLRSAGKAG